MHTREVGSLEISYDRSNTLKMLTIHQPDNIIELSEREFAEFITFLTDVVFRKDTKEM